MINRERIKLLIAALRSGKYEQGRACLKTSDGKYCCLGVACEVFGLENNVSFQPEHAHSRNNMFLGSHTYLPTKVQNWFGFDTFNPRMKNPELTAKYSHLGASFADSLNDHEIPFSEIADAMEIEYLGSPS